MPITPIKRVMFEENFHPSAAEMRTNIFYRFPVEILCIIYASLGDVEDCKDLSATCKPARAILCKYEALIAREWMRIILPGSVHRLGIMTVASLKYDKTTAGDFMEKYIGYRKNCPELPYGLEQASNLQDLVSACEEVMTLQVRVDMEKPKPEDIIRPNTYAGRYPSGTATCTEYLRALRACFMLEIARNLFYDSDGDFDRGTEDGSPPQFEKDLHEKYWMSFSRLEVNAAHLMADCYETCLFDILRLTPEECECVTPEEINDLGCLSERDHPAARLFSLKTGVVQLLKWHTPATSGEDYEQEDEDEYEYEHCDYCEDEYRPDCEKCNRPVYRRRRPKVCPFDSYVPHDMYNKFEEKLQKYGFYNRFDEFLRDETFPFAETLFQPDPNAINPFDWDVLSKAWAEKTIGKYYDRERPRNSFICQGLWDQETLDCWEIELLKGERIAWERPSDLNEVKYETVEYPSDGEDMDDFDTESEYEDALDRRAELYRDWKESWSWDMSFKDYARNNRYEADRHRSGMGWDDGYIPSEDEDGDEDADESDDN
ncbi:hypothetical protein F4774DRAFT_126331 [Daldinia eschscholtzii]|nr:hypothetical protein F4774DRAFT_126331 [Daldinia eschscholtzii]